jgi:hypothetical protein
MPTIDATATTTGSHTAVWALLEDVSAWPRWGAWTHAEVEGGGPQQPGAVRVLVKRPYRMRERITEWEPGQRMGYEVLEGMKVTGYQATVTLDEADGGGTRIRWHSTYERAGALTAFVLRLAVRDACKRLAKAANA